MLPRFFAILILAGASGGAFLLAAGCGGDEFSQNAEASPQAGAGGSGDAGASGGSENGGSGGGGSGNGGSGQAGSEQAGAGGSGQAGSGAAGEGPGGAGQGGDAGQGGSGPAGAGGSGGGSGGAGGGENCPAGTIASENRCLTFGGVYQKTDGVCVVPNPLVGDGTASSAGCGCPAGFTAQEVETLVPVGATTLGFCGRGDGGGGLWGGVYLLNKSVTDGCYEPNPVAGGKCTCKPGYSAEYAVTEGLLMKAAASDWSGFLGLSTCYPGDSDVFSSLPSWETFRGMFLSTGPSGGATCLSGNPLLSLDKPQCDCQPGDTKVLLKLLSQGNSTGNTLADLGVCLRK